MFDDIDINEDRSFLNDTWNNKTEGFFSTRTDDISRTQSQIFDSIFQFNSPQESDDLMRDYEEDEEDDLLPYRVELKDQETKSSVSSQIFSISKDFTVRNSMKWAMRKKAEKIKSLLGEKSNRDFLVLENAKPTKGPKRKLTEAEKREIKLIQNRASAQKSRELLKEKMKFLQTRNAFLNEENSNLKAQNKEKDKTISYLVNQAQSCNNCRDYAKKMNKSGVPFLTHAGIPDQYRKHFGGVISLIGLLCFLGMMVFFGGSYSANPKNNQFPIRQLMTANYPNYNSQNKKDLSMKSNNDFVLQKELDDYYIKNDVIKEMLKNHPLHLQILQLLNENHPVTEQYNTKEKIDAIKSERETYLIDLFNKLRVANSINEIQAVSKKSKTIKEKKEKGIRSYQYPTCVNPTYIDKSKEKTIDIKKENRLPIVFNPIKKIDTKVKDITTVYISDLSSTEETTIASSINMKKLISKPTNTTSSLTSSSIPSSPQNSTTQDIIFNLLVPMAHDEDSNSNDNDNSQEILLSNITRTSTNRDSFYEVGCKIFSISKIS